MSVWLNTLLILAGAVLIAVAQVRAIGFAPGITQPGPHRLWRILSALMSVFLVGYGGALLLVVLGRTEALASLVAVIFAAGGLFVLLTVSLAIASASQLESEVREQTEELRRKTRDLEAAKRAAEAANRAKSQFLANMSHELRTPLNSVVGFTNVLRKNKRQNLVDKDLLYLGRILENGKRLLALINDILDLSKIETGHMELQLEQVDLEKLVQDTVGQFAAELRTTPVKLLTEMPPGMAPIETDRGKLTQVLVNLISNALKFTAKGQVRLRVAVGAKSRVPVRIEVTDTGIGIPEDKLERIFEEFRQADGSTSRRYGGTGLGLSISRSLCRLMGYQLAATSRGRGWGATFTITLVEHPAEAVDEPHELKHSQEIRPLTDEELEKSLAAALSAKTVLVIDDRSELAHYVRDLGAVVLEAGSGDEGLKLAPEVQPDLITVDATALPADGGVLRQLRSTPELAAVPVLLVGTSAALAGELPPKVDRLGKPVQPEELLKVLWRNLFKS